MIDWSPQQDHALQTVQDWYENDRDDKPIFRLFGVAGTGKTTLARHFAEHVPGTVKFATFTGKAAHVMAQKGCVGASTVHRLIYRPKQASKEHLRSLEHQLEDHKAVPKPDYEIIDRIIQEIEKERENVGRMSFSLNLESDLRFAKLLVLDECSTVNAQMGKDLESFGIPILVLGDPEQLPPIYGAGYFTEQKPDVMLHEIHRQALDNPIIAMSKVIREGRDLALGNYGSSRVIDFQLKGDEILRNDIILTGLRKTKKLCDDKARELLSRPSKLPVKGDKLICVKNNHALGLLNGQMYVCKNDSIPLGDGTVSLHIQDIDSGIDMAVSASEKLFYGTPMERWEHEEDIEEFEYAYAITVHKAQGSQWDNVLLFDQKDRFPNMSKRDRQRWLYTGITRAAESVTVMRL